MIVSVVATIGAIIVVLIINALQRKIPSKMGALRDWSFLPMWMHSLSPYDKIFEKCSSSQKEKEEEEAIEIQVVDPEKHNGITANGRENGDIPPPADNHAYNDAYDHDGDKI